MSAAPGWVRPWFRGGALYGAAALALLAWRPLPAEPLVFWGFIGTALAFQLAFWLIGGDPVRHRPLMLAAVAEKLAFVLPAGMLAAAGRVGTGTLLAGAIDLVLGAGFLLAWRATPRPA